MYLRHIGISLQTRSSLLRSSGGSLRYDKVAELLRRTELDALVAARSQAVVHSYFADDGEEQEDPYEQDEEDFTEGEYFDDEDFAAYAEAEGNETEEAEEDEPLGEGEEDEYGSAMLGYLEARKKLMSLRKSRGFKEPQDSSAPGKGSGAAYDRERRDHWESRYRDNKERDRGRPSSGPRRNDFGWKERDHHRGSSHPRGGRRPGTPPPTRRSKGFGKGGLGKGKSKSKAKSGRSGGQSRRGEPSGSQFLGMAVESLGSEFAFRPEFSYVAFPVASSTMPSSTAASQEFSYVSRHSFSEVEALVSELLVMDEMLGPA